MLRQSGKMSPATALAVIYGVFGILWIVLSDALVGMFFQDPYTLTLAQTSKGWVFVMLSALLILGAGSRLMTALEASDERYRLLFADSPQPMVVYDPATFRFVEANHAAIRVFGYSAQEFAGMPVVDVMAPEDRPQAQAVMERARLFSEAHDAVWSIRCKDGRIVQVETRGRSVLYGGRVVRLIVITDITAQMLAEGALIRTLDRLARQERDRVELARALAHDTREPLRQISGFIQLLERRYGGQLDSEADQFVAFATEGIQRLNQLLADLQRFADSRPVEWEEVPVGSVVAEVLGTLKTRLDAAETIVCIGEMPVLPTDRRNLAVVLTCLFDNAIKFRRQGVPNRVEIEAEHLGLDWLFSVRDNGIGIEPEFREMVFNLFSRLHTRDRIPGNGTGLALARKLVQALGGDIWVEEGGQGGSTFRFTLPAHPRPAANIDM